MWVALTSLTVTAVVIIAALFAMRAASSSRTPQGAVGWVVFLLSAPFLAAPLYLFLGHHRFRGYRISRRESQEVIEGIRMFSAQNAPAPDSTPVDLAPFEYCANLPAARGNSARLLVDGAATFDAIFAAIDAAREYVLIQFYIMRDDDLGRALQGHLIAAAERGVQVRLMTDGVGSFRLSDEYKETLRKAGVDVANSAQGNSLYHRFQINYRNHRKTVVVDGSQGFTGGLNVGDEYMGHDPAFGHWRDTHVEIVGPMVSQLQLIFAEDWHFATGEALIDVLNWQAPQAPENATGLIVATGPGDLTETGGLMYFAAITAARERIWIASPYFVPDIDIMTALRLAAVRGVDVRIMVPDMADHRVTWLAAFSYFDDIAEAGARIYRYTDGFMHQKVFLVDDTLAAIGTTNLDNRSCRLNFEAMALFFDSNIAAEVADMLERDFESCYQLTRTIEQQSRYIRFGAPVARLLSPLL